MKKTAKTLMTRRRKQFGFTLLEMVIAVGVFSVIAIISFGVLNNFLNARDRLEVHHKRIRQIQTLFATLERDFRFTLPRAVRSPDDEMQDALWSDSGNAPEDGELFRLTTTSPSFSGTTADVRRIAWRLEGTDLVRITWEVVDADHDSEERRRLMFEGISDVAVKFFNERNNPETDTSSSWVHTEDSDMHKLPAAVELLVTTEDGREYRRFLEIAGGTDA